VDKRIPFRLRLLKKLLPASELPIIPPQIFSKTGISGQTLIMFDPSKMTVDGWVSYYIQQVESDWEKTQYAGTRYTTLFGYMRREVEGKVKRHFDVAKAEQLKKLKELIAPKPVVINPNPEPITNVNNLPLTSGVTSNVKGNGDGDGKGKGKGNGDGKGKGKGDGDGDGKGKGKGDGDGDGNGGGGGGRGGGGGGGGGDCVRIVIGLSLLSLFLILLSSFLIWQLLKKKHKLSTIVAVGLIANFLFYNNVFI